MRSMQFWNTDRKLLVDVLALLLGINAWISVTPIFNQLPLLVHTAPERWQLASYINVICNLAIVGILLYGLKRKCCPKILQDKTLIYLFMFTGCALLLTLIFVYDHTVVVFGEVHSIPLFVITFCTSLIGCTSAVLFVPFMNNFPEIYIVSYMVGEGLSLLLPSTVSLLQGVGNNYCVNVTLESGKIISEERTHPAKFSSPVFFSILCTVMCFTSVMFVIVSNSETVKNEKKSYMNQRNNQKQELKFDPLEPAVNENNKLDILPEPTESSMSSFMYSVLLSLETLVSMFLYGVMASIEPYSALPYGNVPYHLAVNFGRVANPVACFLMFFIPVKQLSSVLFLCMISILGIIYQTTMAALSPTPPLQDTNTGAIIVVSMYVATIGLLAYLKLSIASFFHREGGHGLFWYGVATQVGATLGALVSFYIVSYAELFESYDVCNKR